MNLTDGNTPQPLAGVAVVLVSKFPAPGKVKTRLTPALSPVQAAAVHRCFLLHLAGRMASLGPAQLFVAFDPPDARQAMAELLAAIPDIVLVPQVAGDLGQRLAHVAGMAAMAHGRVLLMAVDSPDVPLNHILLCARQIDHYPVVLGLSDDGGYWCIGLSGEADAALLLHRGIDWSTERTAEHTLANGARLGYRHWSGAPWADVDRPDDLRRLTTRLAGSPDAADAQLCSELCRVLPMDFLRPAGMP